MRSTWDAVSYGSAALVTLAAGHLILLDDHAVQVTKIAEDVLAMLV